MKLGNLINIGKQQVPHLLPRIPASMSGLVEIDSLEATVIIDNEIDSLSTTQRNTVTNNGRLPNIALSSPATVENRGGCMKELQMEDICSGAHGLSILLVCQKCSRKFLRATKYGIDCY